MYVPEFLSHPTRTPSWPSLLPLLPSLWPLFWDFIPDSSVPLSSAVTLVILSSISTRVSSPPRHLPDTEEAEDCSWGAQDRSPFILCWVCDVWPEHAAAFTAWRRVTAWHTPRTDFPFVVFLWTYQDVWQEGTRKFWWLTTFISLRPTGGCHSPSLHHSFSSQSLTHVPPKGLVGN